MTAVPAPTPQSNEAAQAFLTDAINPFRRGLRHEALEVSSRPNLSRPPNAVELPRGVSPPADT
jgi:hypothetical protein